MANLGSPLQSSRTFSVPPLLPLWLQPGRLQAMVLARRGWCELSAGEPEPALKRFEEVVARCESSDEDVKGDALRGLTKASLSLGRVEEARAYLKKHAREPELTSLLKLLDEASRR